MPEYQYLGITTENNIITLTMSNPPANLLSKALLTEINTFLDSLAQSPQAKVLILTGAGSFFIVGADVKEIANIQGAANGTEASLLGQRVIGKLEQLPVATIAAINGHCLGGGNELAMACSIRIASDRARFGQPEINLGIIPGFGGTQRLPRIVGLSRALELMLTGDLINAQTAFEIGLVNKVIPEAEVMKQALGLAKKIASKSKKAVERILKASQEGLQGSLEKGLQLESQLFGQICETEDMQEGLKAFLEKRQPKFQDK